MMLGQWYPKHLLLWTRNCKQDTIFVYVDQSQKTFLVVILVKIKLTKKKTWWPITIKTLMWANFSVAGYGLVNLREFIFFVHGIV
jgi:hypothetical protein